MQKLGRLFAVGALILLLPSLGWTQAGTDFSEMDQWVKDTAHQGNIPHWHQDYYGELGAVQGFHAAWDDQIVPRHVWLEDAGGC